jgi:AcrR family transcriptional regulator
MPRHALTDDDVIRFRKTIQSAAAKIVGAGGLAQLSMRGLADSLGITAGALYRYYPSKQELIIDFCRDAINDLQRRLHDVEETVEDPLQAIRLMLKAYAEFGLEDRDRFRMLFLENDQGLTMPLMQNEETLLPYLRLEAQISKAVSMTLIETSTPQNATQIVWGAVHGLVTLFCTMKDFNFGDVNQLLDEMIEIVIHGLSTKEVSS